MSRWRRALAVVVGALAVQAAGAAPATALAQSQPPSLSFALMTKDIRVDAGGLSTQTVHVELKIGNAAAAMQSGQQSIPFQAEMETLEIVSAYTRKADGSTVPVAASAIYEQQAPNAQQTLMFTDQRQKVIVFPQVAAGDTLVYDLKLQARKPHIPGHFWYGDVFPKSFGFAEVRESLTAPKTMVFKTENHEVEFTSQDLGGTVVYRWHYAAPNPVTAPASAVSPLDKMPRFFISDFTDYPQLGAAYAALSAPKMAVTPKIRELADKIAAGTADRRRQTELIYEWVSKNIRYVGIELGTGSMIPHQADEIVANGYGDCKDHAVLLGALLKAKGIESENVLINSGNAYSLTDVPTFVQLNHAITWLPEFNLYLDSTAAIAPFGVLPLDEYGKPVIHAVEGKATLRTVPPVPPGVSGMATTTVSVLDKDNRLTGTTTTTATGPFAVMLRQFGLGIELLGPENAAARLLQSMGYSGATGTFELAPPTELGPSYSITASFVSPGWEDTLKNSAGFYLPGGLRLLGLSGDGAMGPFYPADNDVGETVCASVHAVEDLSLQAPPGRKFSRVPDDVQLRSDAIQFSAHWQLSSGRMSVHREFTSKIDRAICSAGMRRQNKDLLKKIGDSYNVTISFVSDGQTGPGRDNDADYYNRGLADARAGQTEKAIDDFDRALRARSGNADALVQRGDAYRLKGEYARAIADETSALAIAPGNPQALVIRSGAYLMLRDDDKAIADASEAIRLDPNNAAAYELRGFSYRRGGKAAASADDYGRAIVLKPDSATALVGRAAAYALLNRADEALADAEKALKIDPAVQDGLAMRGDAYLAKGQIDRAMADFDQAIKAAPKAADGFMGRGMAYFARRDYDAALSDFDQAVRLNPDMDEAYSKRAMAYRAKGDLDRAASEAGKAIDRASRSARYYLQRGDIYVAKRDLDAAVKDYDRAVQQDPSPLSYNARADAFLLKLDTGRALADLNEALRIQPDNITALSRRAFIYQASGSLDAAVTDLDATLKLRPKSGYSANVRGIVYRAKGDIARADADFATAIRDYDELVAANPGNPGPVNDRCWARALADREMDKALADCNQALQTSPGNRGMLNSRGLAYFRLGKYQQAVADYDAALGQDKRDNASLFMRGVAKLRLGLTRDGNADIAAAKAMIPNVELEYATYGIKP